MYTYVTKKMQALAILNAIEDSSWMDAYRISVDTETTSLNPYEARLLLISISTPSDNYVFDMTKLSVAMFKQVLENPHIIKLGHNLTYDYKIFYHHGIALQNMHDTMITDRLIHAVGYKMGFSLADVTKRRLGITRDKSIRDGFINKTNSFFSEEELLYAAEDTSYLHPIYEQQMTEMKKLGLMRVYQLEMSIIAPTAMMEYTGVYVNKDLLSQMKHPFEEHIRIANKALQDLFIAHGAADTIVFSKDGYYCVNTNSTQQIKDMLARVGVNIPTLNVKDVQRWELEQKKSKKKKTDDFSYFDIIDDEEIANAIDQYPGVENKYLRALGFLKGARILLNTFIYGILDRIDNTTGRVHPSFNSLGAMATGRYSSTRPNFQNIPTDKKLQLLGLGAYSIRNCIEASQGKRIIIADFASIELVILAALSNDQHLLEEILRGDVHTFVVREVLNYKDITPQNKKKEPHKFWRDAAKTLSYGIAYGTTGRNISETLNVMLASQGYKITPQDGDALIAKWYSLFPTTANYLNANARKAVLDGYVTDAWGRRRNWDRSTFIDKWKRFAAEREGKNAGIQGSSATMTKRAIQLFWERADKTKARMIICVHDEIVVEADEEYTEQACALLKEAMEQAIKEVLPNVAHDVGKYEGTSVDPKVSVRYDK